MKNLIKFMRFDWESFTEGKEYTVVGCTKWTDFMTHEELGTKVEAAITKDETNYCFKDGVGVTNLLEKITFKVRKKVNIPANSKVMPVSPTVSAYGRDRNGNLTSYLNNLSIVCDDIKTL